MREAYLFILILSSILSACRKDRLHPEGLEKVDMHTTTDRLNKILFLNDNVGFVVGGNRFDNAAILKTVDGGSTWSYQSFSDNDKGIYGITNALFNRLYTIGWMGILNISEDEGDTWQKKQTLYEEYKDLAFAHQNRVVAVGGISFITGYIMYLDADGSVIKRDSLAHELNDIENVDGKTAYICGYGVVYKTADSMKTWELLDVKNDNFTAIHAYENNSLWMCGYNGSIFHSEDGGGRWEKKRNGNAITKPRYRLLDIAFADALHGYAVGENGLVIYTDDGGGHWMEYQSFTHVHLRSIAIKNDGTVFICGDEGSLFRMQPMQ